jgi:hypothetical protein
LHTTPRPYLVWIGFAIVLGIGLRFLALPDFMLPVMVGLAVTAGVTLVLHLLLSQLPAATTPAGSTATSRRSGLHKKLPPVAGARSDA